MKSQSGPTNFGLGGLLHPHLKKNPDTTLLPHGSAASVSPPREASRIQAETFHTDDVKMPRIRAVLPNFSAQITDFSGDSPTWGSWIFTGQISTCHELTFVRVKFNKCSCLLVINSERKQNCVSGIEFVKPICTLSKWNSDALLKLSDILVTAQPTKTISCMWNSLQVSYSRVVCLVQLKK